MTLHDGANGSTGSSPAPFRPTGQAWTG